MSSDPFCSNEKTKRFHIHYHNPEEWIQNCSLTVFSYEKTIITSQN